MFDDILIGAGLPLEVPVLTQAGDMLVVEFAAVLDASTRALVRDRLVSVDGAQETQLANLRALRDADPFDCEALSVALANYMLGETP